jgi:hypothetical protein
MVLSGEDAELSDTAWPHPVQNLMPGSSLFPHDMQNAVAEAGAGATATGAAAGMATAGASTLGAGWFDDTR